MTLQQWFDEVGGRVFPGAKDNYRGQCVDLAQDYARRVCGDNSPYLGNANGWWNNFNSGLYAKIPNTPSFVPARGDIAVWGGSLPYGHIAICTGEGNVNWFKSLDNNWPWGLDQNDHPTAVITHNYNNFLGVLRPKRDINFDQAAYDAAQRAAQEAARIAKEAEDARIAAEAAKVAEAARIESERLAAEKAEADRIAKEQAAAEKKEQERIAAEQAKLDAIVEAQKAQQQKWYAIWTEILNWLKGLIW